MNSNRVITVTLVLAGIYYAAVGILLWAVPGFFYAHVGRIGAYNAHYERDLGSFVLPLGIALIAAAPAPAKHRLLLAAAGVASLLHAFSHLAEGVRSAADALTLLFFFIVAAALGACWWFSREVLE
ncbi:MAG TPA: hypothetical protein VGI19_19440 [Candidatus Cybelea sp.]